MSADRWSICPRCKKGQPGPPSVEYGKVSEEEYVKAKNWKPEPIEETMREDWSIGTDENGEFSVDYSCGCKVCGFGFSYKHEQKAH